MRSDRLCWADVRAGVLWYALSAFPVALGVSFGIGFVSADRARPVPPTDVLTACSRFDGGAYAAIAQHGYSYDPDKRSTVAYFPAYPLLGRAVVALTGWDVRLALLVVSNLALVASFILFSAYIRVRPSAVPVTASAGVFALWPAGFFFRMTYSESTLLALALLFLCGVARRWPLPVLAFLAGLVTATRPVGVAATAAFAWYILSDATRGGVARRALVAVAYSPLAAWGLLAYMGYQYACFGTPLAFAQTQEHWTLAPLHPDPWEKVEALLVGEPIWGCYDPASLRYWARGDSANGVFFNLAFWNPVLFVAALVLIVCGAVRSWLSGTEVALGFGLLLIPYVTRAYEMSMAGHGRFAAVVVPAYIVVGGLLHYLPNWGVRAVLVIGSCTLMIWSALFASAHLFY